MVDEQPMRTRLHRNSKLVGLIAAAAAATALVGAPSAQAEPQYLGEFGSGELDTPATIAIGPNRYVYVLDALGRKVFKYTPEGTLVSSFGSHGDGDGQFNIPIGIAVAPNNDVVVVDAGNVRLSLFTADGAFKAAAGWGVQDGAAEFQICTSGCQAGQPGAGLGQLNAPYAVAVANDGAIFVPDSDDHRVQRFSPNLDFESSFGSVGTAAGELSGPQAVASDADRNVYVAEVGNNRISKFSSSESFLSAWGFGVLNGAHALQVCTVTCQAGISGNGDGQIDDVLGMAIERSSGTLYTSDTTDDRVQMFSATGAFVGKFGSTGSGPGQFVNPGGVALDCKGSVYVVDIGNKRVQRFGTPGTAACSLTGEDGGNGQGGGGDGGGGTTDAIAPSITSLKASPTKLSSRAKSKKKTGKSVSVSYDLSEAASVRFTIEQAKTGHRSGKACKKTSRSNRKKPKCTFYARVGSRSATAASGSNSTQVLSAKAAKRLRAGKYRVVAVATDSAGNSSKQVSTGFKVSRR